MSLKKRQIWLYFVKKENLVIYFGVQVRRAANFARVGGLSSQAYGGGSEAHWSNKDQTFPRH